VFWLFALIIYSLKRGCENAPPKRIVIQRTLPNLDGGSFGTIKKDGFFKHCFRATSYFTGLRVATVKNLDASTSSAQVQSKQKIKAICQP